MKKISIAEIKAHVEQTEGFSVEINGNANRTITTQLYLRRAPGTMTVSQWIERCFPECVDGEVRVLRKPGSPAAKNTTLESVRKNYPENFRKIHKDRALKADKVRQSEATVAEQSKKLRAANKVNKQQAKANVTEVNQRQAASHEEAAWQALDQLVRNDQKREPARRLYHARAIELCQLMLQEEEMDTESVLKKILAAWSHAEIEKDRLTQ